MQLTNTMMKIALAALAIAMFGISAVAQKQEEEQEQKITAKAVPAAVKSAFKSAYPNATIRGYAKEKENGKVFYEIESREGTKSRDLLYNADGTVAEIEESIAVSELPSDAQDALHKQYPKAVVSKAEKTTAGDKIGYELVGRQGKKRISMEFDASGKVLKSTAK